MPRPAPREQGAAPDPRQLAAAMLYRVLGERQMIDDAPGGTDPARAARARRLALTTLRHLSRADTVLKPLLRKLPPPRVHAILRLATVEMCELGAPAHGVVDGAVAATRAVPKGAAFAGLVNAVLRRVAEISPDAWARLPVPRLPGWLRKRLILAWGGRSVEAIEAAHLAGAPLDLTLAAMPPEDRSALVAALADAAGPVAELPRGTLRLAGTPQVSALPGYAAGRWWVQDAAAALAAPLIGAQPGMRVLDLCAAPGGKTMQLADGGAEVTALDLSDARMRRLRANLERTGLSARLVVADALDWVPPDPFDAVLLDAPCSATGTIRRHPDLPHVRREADLAGLVALQARLIDRAVEMVRVGGTLVFCTCSLLPEEGEAQIAAALARHGGRLALSPLPAPPLGRAAGGGWRTRPDDPGARGGIDGFFIARMTRIE
ncbi:transcription antitermination factor NusB [Pararhodobacter sp. SW119]|uniref:RsmB/NOP family class I SAM-dependent RNA methyltransferase n=1 Tax=Pararhodobacter sp. SW119 TaxID=2780075 RepID=UPI001ADF864F|nr:transcription antitermination factor NusB [Pararhodobacter sp. SW119]